MLKTLRALWLAAPLAQTTMVERIVAQVNGEIITESEVREREQSLLNELYRQNLAQEELEKMLAEGRAKLVSEMIHELLMLQKATELGIKAEGPVPPDTLFSKAKGGWYTVAVAMYHDQGHIACKVAGFVYDHATQRWSMTGVNVTLGLPIIRTSVDHGTAFGKAGKGTADQRSLVEATRLAAELVKGRQ